MTRSNAKERSQTLSRIQWGAALSVLGALGVAAALSAADIAAPLASFDKDRFRPTAVEPPLPDETTRRSTFVGRIGPEPKPAPPITRTPLPAAPMAEPPEPATIITPSEAYEGAPRPQFTEREPQQVPLYQRDQPVETIEERMTERAVQFMPRPGYDPAVQRAVGQARRQQPQIEVVRTQAEEQPQLGDSEHFEVIPQTGTLEVNVGRSLLLRTKQDIYRTAVVDAKAVEVVQFTPREVSLIGKGIGATHVTFWFKEGDGIPVTYLVRVSPNAEARKNIEQEYFLLESLIHRLFPDSKVYLMQVADKLIVRGQARSIEEAAQIMTVIRGQAGRGGNRGGNGWGNGGWGYGGWGSLAEGAAAQVLNSEETGRANRQRVQVINMLRVPGVQQVALKVKIAELNRTAARGLGVDVNARINLSDSADGSMLFLQSMLNVASGNAPGLLAQFDGDDIQVGISYLQQRGVVRLLSEPTLVTMSGRSATFVAGGEFAVPTVVGTSGLNAITTDFRSFGVIISFMPTVIDKDNIRLQVSPEFSQINASLSVGSTPGLNVRAVTTTVEMREGQTLAIAGLLEDTMTANKSGNVPGLSWLFGNRSVSRNETELIILVTPELIHPMEADEVPPLPGFDVTEPNNGDFFLHGRLEGTPTLEYRSTVWPHLKNRYKAGGSAMISGPFGHGR